ncbi:MAG: ABC transporter ATP-binding protein [Anaerolineales bacterium]
MNTPSIIHLKDLSKTFGKGASAVKAVADLNLEISPGQVYGFLGRNGAGKTTTIRLLLGLIHPSSGLAMIQGEETKDNPRILRQVGSLVEDPGFYNFMSGWENLRTLVYTAGSRSMDQAEDLLEKVGLEERASDKVAGYSKGMRQRLGLAAALLGDPELVILDEPTNGLDPNGIQEIRRFIRRLVEEDGKTVFLSSHLLGEVEQICDRVAIIHRGRIIREGEVASLLAGAGGQIRIQVQPLSTALETLQPKWQVVEIPQNKTSEPPWIEVQAAMDQVPELVRQLAAAGVDVHQVVEERFSLEEFFLQSTGEEDAND